jgi:DNA-binding transcriptional LysR family regulator
METNRIRQFRVIVETGNLRKAAELLNVSHSGLSKSMKALERELGFELLLPSGRGITVSDRGRRLYERSSRFLEECQKLTEVEETDAKQTLRLGSFETFTSYFVGPLLKRYFQSAEIEIHELVPGRLEDALSSGRIDIGVTYEPVPQKGIDYVKATSIKMGAYAIESAFDSLAINEIPFIAPVRPIEGTPSGVKGQDGWPDAKIERMIRYRVDLMTTGLEIARQGLAAIYIPHFVARLHNQSVNDRSRLVPLRARTSLPAMKREVFIVKRESTAESKTMRVLARALREICADDER